MNAVLAAVAYQDRGVIIREGTVVILQIRNNLFDVIQHIQPEFAVFALSACANAAYRSITLSGAVSVFIPSSLT
nr:hypothetical protein [uncultured Oscillibacter sp.]